MDGGNSKTDVALVSSKGDLLARVRGPSVSHQVVGAREGGERLASLVQEAHALAGEPGVAGTPRLGVYCLAGADFPSDVRLIRREFDRYSLAHEYLVMNDCFAALRAGAEKGWGIVLICGQGINAAGVGPNGRTARFAGIGLLSGDWGGGGGLGEMALQSAIRGRDGRGPRTSLEHAVAAHFGFRTAEAVMLAMYEGRLSETRLNELSPAVFQEAEAGDPVARTLIDRLDDELVAMAGALFRRLRLTRQVVDVVLAGGVFNAHYEPFHQRLAAGIRRIAPDARLVRPVIPPVAGAALIGLDMLSKSGNVDPKVAGRLSEAFATAKGAADV